MVLFGKELKILAANLREETLKNNLSNKKFCGVQGALTVRY